MKLSSPSARVFSPSGLAPTEALRVTRQLGVVAHADDLEIAAIKGILDCYEAPIPSFSGVVVCDGVGAPRQGADAGAADEDYRRSRENEQEVAATVGRYAAVAFLGHPSAAVRAGLPDVGTDLDQLLQQVKADVIYTHSPLDAHDTHVAVVLELIDALRRCPSEQRPARVIGCEVWRDLDWLPESHRVALDVGKHQDLQQELIRAFGSQTAGKRYDLASLGRRQAHATFRHADRADETSGLVFGVDLTPLLAADAPSVEQFSLQLVEVFQRDTAARLGRLMRARGR
jgi:LmbE family N-acetylglucosaminyl deacetylase